MERNVHGGWEYANSNPEKKVEKKIYELPALLCSGVGGTAEKQRPFT